MPPSTGLLRKFGLYLVIGAAAFAVDYTVFLTLFAAFDNPYIANMCGICGGIVVSFSLNRTFNFRRSDAPARRATRFVTVATLGMVVSTLAIMLLIRLDIDARLAKVIAMSMVFALQFLMNALWTFR